MEGRIDKKNGSHPVYRQVRDILEAEICEIYSPGYFLPSEMELASRFKINRHTLRRAIDELVNDGFVGRIRGKGTFVIRSVVDYEIKSTTRFTENLASQGRQAQSEVLRKIALPAPKGVAERLGLADKEPVALIETLRFVDELPFCIVSHFLPYAKFHLALKKYARGSFHQFIGEQYKITLKRTLSLISAVLAQKDDAELLNTSRESPLLRVKSLNVDASTGEPVEYVVTRFRGDATQLSVEP
ncbi:MAG: phosphonate metabolism transcriptional regulator PhnF [Proteobacteria bacterium]|nr:phosphonate metabolism transcriptional regulator PhnF [Pseudomonadota bacterium]MBU1641099.1 phosphonate metabolism transcriptional regulator PhnF [Pseudomonadota bacterium]